MTYEEYDKAWAEAFVAAGHTFKMKERYEDDDPDEPDRIDFFVVSSGYHNGPGCTTCGWSCCQHCTAISDIPQCEGPRP